MTTPIASACFTAILIAAAVPAAAAPDPSIATYTASYRFEYEGKDSGTSQFSVQYDAATDLYEFRSQTTAKGVLKLASPKPLIERSSFRVVGGVIQPLEFWYEDGSRKGEDNFHIVFNWQTGTAVVTSNGAARELKLEPGTVDRGSLQVALMRDVAARGVPGRYLIADSDSVNAYEYVDKGEQTITTGSGALAARSFTQQREGSSRSNTLWFAPTLKHLPVRIEQRKNGELKGAFVLDKADGLP